MSDFNQMADFSTSIDYDLFAAPGLGSTDLNPQLEDNSALKKLQRTFKTSGYSRSEKSSLDNSNYLNNLDINPTSNNPIYPTFSHSPTTNFDNGLLYNQQLPTPNISSQQKRAASQDSLTGSTLTASSTSSTTQPTNIFDSGYLTVGATGTLEIDYLFDGGAYQGELGIFNLEGMEQFTPGSDAFTKEAARRALTGSNNGHIIISDINQGAKFTGSVPWEGNSNVGTYSGIRTFSMRPGDKFGFILAPNRTMQDMFDRPGIWGGGNRPLFSLSTPNPNDSFSGLQMVDVTGDKTAFAWEDIQADSTWSDRDYNDLIFQIKGATGPFALLKDHINPARDWRSTSVGQSILTHIDSQYPPQPSAALVNDTGSSASDRITTDPTISGTVTNASRATSFRAGFNPNSINFDLLPSLTPDGSFSLTRDQLAAINGGSLPDGSYTLYLQAINSRTNASTIAQIPFVLDTAKPSGTLTLSESHDTEPVGDNITTLEIVTLVGQTEPNSSVILNQTGALFTADTTGRFEFPNVSLALGDNSFSVLATDVAGNTNNTTSRITRTLLSNVDIVLQEGTSFNITHQQTFVIPNTPSVLSFTIADINFDNADLNGINDAFEVALVDAEGRSLVHTIATGRDAFFNLTEGLVPALSAGVTFENNRVSVNLSGVQPGTQATLVLRLVNSDRDSLTRARIRDIEIVDSANSTPPVGSFSGDEFTSLNPVDLAKLSDVSASILAEYGRTSFNADAEILATDLAMKNAGQYKVRGQLLMGIANISDPSVRVKNADFVAADGISYFNFTSLVDDGILSPGEMSGERTIEFYNPNQVQFNYEIVVKSELNSDPVFTSTPDEEAVIGRAYVYDVDAIDKDNDRLTYSLLSAPQGLVIDEVTGKITWTPLASQVGNHAVRVKVSDSQGGEAFQQYSLSTIVPPPNRPPVFSSIPVVDARVNEGYLYQAVASDADSDNLTFSLVNAPTGMTVNASTGVVSWTPSAFQVGMHNVKLLVNDGVGGIAEQNFQVLTQIESGNRAPIITSLPETTAYLNTNYTYQVKALDPDADIVKYELVNPPTGMRIDSHTGIITWNNLTAGNAGRHDIAVKAQDTRGGVDIQNFSLFVSNVAPGLLTGKVYKDNRQPTDTLVYFNNFENPNQSYSEWSNPITDVTPRGSRRFLGQYSSISQNNPRGKTSLSLTNLPDHDTVTVSFDLHIIQSWDGNANWLGGPALWELSVAGGPTLLRSTFLNVDGYYWSWSVGQSYPDSYPGGNHPPRTGADEINTLGYGFYGDSTYKLSYTFNHNDPSVVLNFLGAAGNGGITDINNESWGLDNVEVRVGSKGKGLANSIVYIDTNNNGQREENEPFTFTDDKGKYSFTLAPGNYKVAQVLPPGWTRTAPTSNTYAVNLAGGQTVAGLDFGNTNATSENVAPKFLSMPLTNAMVGQKYRYRPVANDLNGDKLAYELVVRPDGMVVDSTTGLIGWQPTSEQLGAHDVVLRVSDGYGGVDLQSFEIFVRPFNSPPLFVTGLGYGLPENPVAVVGQPFEYRAVAQDADNDSITYSLIATVPGASIHPQTGVLTWIPATLQTSQLFTIAASDGKGGVTSQSLNVQVLASVPNDAPVITSSPRNRIGLGQLYSYAVKAFDPNNDPLTIALETAPAGMTIDDRGRVFWQPSGSQFGSNNVKIRASDGRGGVDVQEFTVNVVSMPSNSSPSIDSNPVLAATQGRVYEYDLVGSDSDGDTLFWSLEKAPKGMLIDSERGTIRWMPLPTQVGNHSVIVRVMDSFGAEHVQAFNLRVRSVNVPPTIISSPPTVAAVNKVYKYAVLASDLENDALNYSLVNPPQGMTINRETGLIEWTPAAAQLGSKDVEVLVEDSFGGKVSQKYTVVVSSTAANLPPAITSTPVYAATTNQLYRYNVTANDPEGENLQYGLIKFPPGMTINSTTGVLEWTPASVGEFEVVVGATDASGKGGAQQFWVTVAASDAPVITSNPPGAIAVGETYRYDVRATDTDNLTYSLLSAPEGMTIDPNGRIRWSDANPGSYEIEVVVKDTFGATDTQAWDLNVVADNTPPRVHLWSSRAGDVNRGDEVTFVVTAADDVRVESVELLVNGTRVALDGQGRATVPMNGVGDVEAIATATDVSGNTSTTRNTLRVIDGSDNVGPTIDISSLEDGATITSPIAITGTVNDTNLLYYTLSVAPVAGGEFREIFRSNTPVINGAIATFDPSTLENDTYILRFEAHDNGGNVSAVEQTVNVAGELKLGNFRLSFTDLEIPVAGIPISVTRTYDTLTTNTKDDFGYGWRLEFRDTDLRTSLKPDTTFQELGIPTVGFENGTRVYITQPGGKREGFTFRPKPMTNVDGVNLGVFANYLYVAEFVPDKGVTSKLSVPTVTLMRNPSTNQFHQANRPYNPADAFFGGKYQLTTQGGIVYEIDGTTGDLLTATDTNGNKLTYSDSGIFSDSGKQVTFERDAQGRIVSVLDPTGELIRYQYDANGDLVGVTDREENTTRFEYEEPSKAHFLTSVIDPLGREGVKTEYDASGRLKKMLDVNGDAVELIYDPSNSVQTVKDVFGKATTYVYDARGNILQEVDPLGKVTRRTYDENNNILSETIVTPESGVNGWTTEYTYDDAGNKLTEKDPLGHVTRYTYGANGRLLSSTDSLGNTTTNTYSPRGNLLSTKDAAGNVTKYGYDLRGNLLSLTDANNQVTEFKYDQFGNVTEVKDANGNSITYTYDGNGNRLTQTQRVTTPSGLQELVTKWDYDDAGRVRFVTNPDNQVTEYRYDANGNQIAVIDALLRKTESRYDEKGQLIETVYADNTPGNSADNPRTINLYDLGGRKRADIDQNGRVTHYKYDDAGRLVERIYAKGTDSLSGLIAAVAPGQTVATIDWSKVVYPDATPGYLASNPRSKTEYYKSGHIKARIDERGNRTEYRYNAKGQRIETIYADNTPNTLNDNPRTYTEYDGAGRRISTTDQKGRTTHYKYDANSRLIQTIYPDSTPNNLEDNPTSRTEYDKFGRTKTSIDQAGKVTRYEYDDIGQLKGVIQYLNQSSGTPQELKTIYRYDEAGQLIEVEDANHHITKYEYDKNGQRQATVLPLQQRSDSTYDAVGNLKSVTDFNRETISFDEYDENNRLLHKRFSDGTDIRFTYTLSGKLKTVSDSRRGTTTYDYDERERLISRTDPNGPYTSNGKTIEYKYDAAGNRTEVRTSSSSTTYAYDEQNRLKTVISPQGKTTYFYDSVGNLERTELPNGVTETREYDEQNRLKLVKYSKQGVTLSSFDYTVDAVGNRKVVTEQNGRSVQYEYDDLYRLTKETITDSVAGNRTIEYTYDNVGNRLTRTDSVEGVTTYSYDNNDRLYREVLTNNGTTVSTIEYGYDNNGNTLWSQKNGTQQTVYTWDKENRLIGVNKPTGEVLGYTYDTDGIRVSSTINGMTTNYLVDNNFPIAQVLEEWTNNVLTASYVYGNDLISQQRGGNSSFYLVDGLGSTRGLINASGVVTDAYTYDAFGNLIASTGDTTNNYRFAGEQFDPNLGDYYLRQRYYDTDTGRFTRRDIYEGDIYNPVSLHKYLYANANPVNLTDPTGLIAGSQSEQNVSFLVLGILATLGWITTTILDAQDERICRYRIDEDHIFFPQIRGARITGFHSTARAIEDRNNGDYYWVTNPPDEAEYEPFRARFGIPGTNLERESDFFPIDLSDREVLNLIGEAYVKSGCRATGFWNASVTTPFTGITITIYGEARNHVIETAYPDTGLGRINLT